MAYSPWSIPAVGGQSRSDAVLCDVSIPIQDSVIPNPTNLPLNIPPRDVTTVPLGDSTSCPSSPQAVNNSIGGIRVIISALRSPADRSALPPPTYEEALDPNALSPPPYESLFGQVQATHQASDGVADFVKNLTILFFGTVGCMACIGLAVIVPVAMVVIGSLYFDECPAEEKIPLYLVVGGIVTLLNNLFVNFRVQRSEENDQMSVRTRRSSSKAFITTFMFVWFLLGSLWVYKEYEPSYDPSSTKYCNRTLYLFAFWVITSSYIVVAVISFAFCIMAFLAACIQCCC